MTRSRSGGGLVVIVLGLVALNVAAPARAQFIDPSTLSSGPQNIEGFTVTGRGSVAAKPNRFEIDLEVSSSSELTADAIVKYRDAKRKLEEAFRDLKLETVQVEERGLLVDQKGAMANPYYYSPYGQNPNTKTEVQLSRKLIVTCSKIREMDEDAILQLVGRMLDVAQDAGGQIGSQMQYNPYYYYRYNMPTSGLVRFVLDDFDAIQEQAYEAAVADARTRAQRLARLSGVELGPIVAVREIVVPGENSQESSPPDDVTARRRLESAKFQEIPVRVELLVRFEVRPHPKGEGQAGGR